MPKQLTLPQITRKTLLERFMKVTKKRYNHQGSEPSPALLESFMPVNRWVLETLLNDLGLAGLEVDFQLSNVAPEWSFDELFNYLCGRIKEHRIALIQKTIIKHLATMLRCDDELIEGNSNVPLSDCGESSVIDLLARLEESGITIDPEAIQRVNDTSTTLAQIIVIASGFDEESQETDTGS